MNVKPAFFEPIRLKAFQRWNQLEQDPELAGPWHQLFKQVQSPRHVLSELLQNADDAGATEAFVDIADGCFVFSHNGEDFTEEHFTSLCRFGYSNKRALHTIGFRGIGFKSTFSLGDTVELYTPTLSVAFDRLRFTEPRWIEHRKEDSERTQIRVPIYDVHRRREIEKNLSEWLVSPVSLLFFKHIRRMRIGAQDVHWKSLGPGPVRDTEWMALNENSDEAFLIARSPVEAFPDDALAEIRQERLLSDNQETDFPPCKVEIVLGAKGRLYVVLPTGVETSLPFACNAPYIQDPARLKIKDPETSPTNRWLLERVGKLAASVMLQWLGRLDASVENRSDAYGLFPTVDRDDNSLEGGCATIVEEAFEGEFGDKPFLLTNVGDLKPALGSILIPEELFEIWPAEQAVMLFDEAGRPPLSSHISELNQQKLIKRGVVTKIDKNQVIKTLQSKHLPKPETWRQLMNLWVYVSPNFVGFRFGLNCDRICIVPVQGKEVLYGASDVVRLAEKRLLQSEADWEFLSAHLLVLNQNWPRFLAEQRRSAEEHRDERLNDDVEAAFDVLEAIGLNDTSDTSDVIEQVASEFFGQQGISLPKCIQLTQIAAKLGATVEESFRFATTDRYLRDSKSVILFDLDGTLEEFFNTNWCQAHFLHADYTKSYTSCTSEEWRGWVSSGRAGLLGFAPLRSQNKNVYGRKKIEDELRRRGVSTAPSYHYVTNEFRIEDWDFEDTHWVHWTAIAKEDPNIWGRVVERILHQPQAAWSKAQSARAVHVATNGSTRGISNDPILPAWILKLRELPCLRDTRGFYRKPGELLRRTPETESLMDVEPFVHGHLDSEATRPLLKLLGVRDVPTGPDRLLDCLRALAKAENPPAHEVEKWYRRLDQMIDTCSTADFANIKNAFRDEKIVLTEGAGWTSMSGAFLLSDEETLPIAAVVRAGVRDLMLWRKIGIADRPTADLAMKWLQELPSGEALSSDDVRRVRSLLPRHADRIWRECAHWLNLAGEWVPVDTLVYALSMQSMVSWGHLHQWVKQKTADLQRLPTEVTEAPPFSGLSHLAGKIENRFHRMEHLPGRAERRAWLNQLGAELGRIVLDNEFEAVRIRELALELEKTAWQTTPGLEIIPYIDGVPAGMPRRADVVWLDRILHVEDRPLAKLAHAAAQELGRAFRRQEVIDAIKMCFDRSPEFVTDYMEENFKLGPRETNLPQVGKNDIAANECDTSKNDTTQPPSPRDAQADNKTVEENGEEAAVRPEEPDGEPQTGVENEEFPHNSESTDTLPPRRPQHPKPPKVSIIERFAYSQGFRRDGGERFFHPDGSWIAKGHETRFPWERRTADGNLVCYYWPKDHCLEREPLQIEADIWGMLEQSPDMYALVLSNPHGDPVEVSGSRLRAMRDGGEIILYPATYRLVLDHDRNP